MRLTIFWRAILAQSTLIALIVVVGYYALTQLHQLAILTTGILRTDSPSLEEEKRLLKLFLAQIRSAEKYRLLQDRQFYTHFTQGSSNVLRMLDTIATLVDTPHERSHLAQLRELYTRYAAGLAMAHSPKNSWERDKGELSEGIIARINELIHWREQSVAHKTAMVHDQARAAAKTMGWLSLGGIVTAVLCAYLHARGMSRPLKTLARELLRVGQGEFQRSLVIQAPKEVAELAQTFNRMAAMLAELDRMKADFIAHVSHELRTPLTGIREGTALLLEQIPGPLTASQQAVLEVVWNHSTRLSRSIATILDLAKMEAGMLEYIRTPSDLVTLMTRSMEAVQLQTQKKQLQVEVRCLSPVPLLSLDEERMQEVCDNLLSNAVKFTPEGGTIRVSAALQRNGQGHWVEVRVSDTGKGIPAEDVARVFDKFYQSPYHQQDGHQGTGLGLTIARHIVEAHGGQIWAESPPGVGATFVFTLPIGDNRPHADLPGALIQQNGGWSAA